MLQTRARVLSLGIAASLVLLGTDAAAVELPARVTLGIGIPTLPNFEAEAIGGVQVNSNTPSAGLHLFSLSMGEGFASRITTLPVTDPAAAPIKGLKVTASNAAGFFAEDANGDLTGSMPIRGNAKVCLFGTCGAAVANVVVPLSVIGQGGTAVADGIVNVTVRGAPWTTGTVPLGYSGVAGHRGGPLGGDSTTAQLVGGLSLVTPIFISTNLGAIATIDAYGYVSMRFDGVGTCDVEVDQSVYHDGDTVGITRLRFTSQRTVARDYRLQLYVKAPVADIQVQILDQIVRLGPEFERDIAPIAAIPVEAGQPRGEYRFGCSLTDTGTGELHGDEVAFTLE